MKKLILFCFAAFCSMSIFSSPLLAASTDASAKILEVFHRNFPEITNRSIYNMGDAYMIFFKNDENNSSGRIYYDNDGNVLETIRYYSGTELSPFIRTKVNSKYKGKDIFMVTDVANDTEHFYQIILEDANTLMVVDADDSGSIHLEKKYKKSK